MFFIRYSALYTFNTFLFLCFVVFVCYVGPFPCAAVVLLSCGLCCILRYFGQSEWFRADQRGKFNWDFLNYKDLPLEEVDMSYTVINYTGLVNLGAAFHNTPILLNVFSFFLLLCLFSFTRTKFPHSLSSLILILLLLLIYVQILIYYFFFTSERHRSLRTLKLQGCPEVDDWFLARLHIFQDSLEELDISHCPRITTGGLAALRNLK